LLLACASLCAGIPNNRTLPMPSEARVFASAAAPSIVKRSIRAWTRSGRRRSPFGDEERLHEPVGANVVLARERANRFGAAKTPRPDHRASVFASASKISVAPPARSA